MSRETTSTATTAASGPGPQKLTATGRPYGRCVGCFHPFETGPCGGCGAIEPCDGTCHDTDPGDDCARCGGRIWEQMCDDCRFYAAQDA